MSSMRILIDSVAVLTLGPLIGSLRLLQVDQPLAAPTSLARSFWIGSWYEVLGVKMRRVRVNVLPDCIQACS